MVKSEAPKQLAIWLGSHGDTSTKMLWLWLILIVSLTESGLTQEDKPLGMPVRDYLV